MTRLAFWGALSVLMGSLSGADCALAQVGETVISTWKNGATAAYSFTTDDVLREQVELIGPALTQRGLKGTFYVNPGPQRESWTRFANDYAQLVNDGHELGGHTLFHDSVIPNDPIYPHDSMESLAELRADDQAVNNVLEELTGQETVSFAYPFGRDNAATRAVVAEHYLSGRDVIGYLPDESGHFVPNPPSPPDMYKLKTLLLKGRDWFPFDFSDYDIATDTYQRYAQDTLDAGGWGIEFFHSFIADRVDDTAYYDHLDMIAGLGEDTLWNDTVGNVTRYIYSRDAGDVQLLAADTHSIELALDDGLDDDLFNVPLTLTTEIPVDWMDFSVSATQGDRILDTLVFSEDGRYYCQFDSLANGEAVRLFVTVPEPGTLALLGSLLVSLCLMRRLRRRC